MWLILLTTYTLVSFQASLLEIGHWLAHFGDSEVHHHFHTHHDDHQHEDLANFADLFDTDKDTELPTSPYELKLKHPQLLTTIHQLLPPKEVYPSSGFPSLNFFPTPLFLEIDSPPPDPTIDIG